MRGWEVVGEPFIDNDVSALKGKVGPAYLELLKLVEAGELDGVVTYMTSRLWRNRPEPHHGRRSDARRAAGEFDTHESEVKGERVARRRSSAPRRASRMARSRTAGSGSTSAPRTVGSFGRPTSSNPLRQQ